MKFLLVLTLISSFSIQAEENIKIDSLKELRNEAREMVKNFKLTDLELEVGAYEYPEIQKDFYAAIFSEIDNLEIYLSSVDQKLSEDYSILQSLKKKKKSKALKETIKIASQRIKYIVSDERSAYGEVLKDLIFLRKHQQEFFNKCLSVLCVNLLKQDLRNWFKQATRVNKNLDLDVAKIKRIPRILKKRRQEKGSLFKIARAFYESLPAATTQEMWNNIKEEKRKHDEQEQILREKEKADMVIAEDSKNKTSIVSKSIECEKYREVLHNTYLCEGPSFESENGKMLFVSDQFTEEKHQAICNSQGGIAPAGQISWRFSESYKGVDNFTVNEVICYIENENDDMVDYRFNFKNRELLEDGSFLIHGDLYYNFYDVNANIDRDSDVNQVCQLLGFSTAVRADSWEVSGSRNVYLIKFNEDGTNIREYNRDYTRFFSKISCK